MAGAAGIAPEASVRMFNFVLAGAIIGLLVKPPRWWDQA
jgi:hypothetical protein